MRAFMFAVAVMLGYVGSTLAAETEVASTTINTTTFTEVSDTTDFQVAAIPSTGFLKDPVNQDYEFPTFYTRLGLLVNSYDQYMAIYPMIVEEAEIKHSILSKENPNYLLSIPSESTTCAFIPGSF